MGMNAAAVQRLYVAYFNRPADPTGLAQYEAMLSSTEAATQAELEAIAATYFSPSAEYTSNFAGLSNEAIVNKLYQNLFGRDAEPTGLLEWALALADGSETVASIALQLSFSAQGTDADTIANKIAASSTFTTSLDTTSEIVGYSGDAAATSAATWLATVGSSAASKDTAVAGVDAAITAAVAAGDSTTAAAGQSFALTTGVDALTGGAGADSFVATAATVATTTLTAGDNLAGGAGTDTLSITGSISGGNTLGAGVSSSDIEILSVNAVTTTSVDTSLMAGVTDVYNNGSLADTTYTGLTAIPNVWLTGTSADTTLGYASAATTVGTADTQTVKLNGAAATSSATITTNGVESITVDASGSASGAITRPVILTSDSLKSVTITGDAASAISANLTGATTTIAGSVTGNAAANTVILTADAADTIGVDLGAGNDTLSISTISATHTIAGGDGADTLVAGTSITAATGANISGFEVVSAGAVSVVLPTATNTIGTVSFSGTGGTVAGVASGATVSQAATGSNTISNTAGWTGAADSITVAVGAATAGGAITQSLTATGIETATITNSQLSTDATARSVGVTGANLTKMTVASSGGAPITITGGGVALAEIDASGVAGVVTNSATMAAAGFKLTTGAGIDTLTGGVGADTLIAGAGADTITGGVGVDTLTGGAGVDTFNYATNAAGAVVSSLAAPDVITDFTSGTDKLALSQTVTAFLGNYSNVSQAQAAAAADGRGNLAYFVTGENSLYAVTAANGVASSTDTVITITGVTALAEADLQLGSQGTGNTVSLAAATVPVVNTTSSNATSSTKTTAKDDTITSAASTALVGTGSAIDGGLGADTLNSTLATAGLLTSLTAAGTNGVVVSNVETVNITVTTPTAVVNLGTGVPTTLSTLTVTGSNGDGALQATTTATGQTFTVTNTGGSTASAVTVANFANNTVTTGSAGDTITVSGGAATTSASVNAGAGADTVVVSAATAWSGLGNALSGGSNLTGTVDTLQLNYDIGNGTTLDLAAMITAGDIAAFERVNINADQGATIGVTAGTGITQYVLTDTTAGEAFNITATSAQANAITSITGDAADTVTLLLSDAGTVSLSGDTTTALDAITYDAAVDLTLSNTATAVTQGGGTPGTAAQTITIGDGSAVQSATINSTGAATFNVTAAALATVAVADVDNTVSAAEALTSFIAVAGATAVVNVTGAGGNFTLLDATPAAGDDDLVLTNIDTVNINTTSASIVVAGNEDDEIDFTLNLGAFSGHSVHLDTIGTANSSVTITGFAAGTGGDVVLIGEPTTAGNTDMTTVVVAATTGGTLPGTGTTATAATSLYVATGSGAQISGALTDTGDAGSVEAAIIAAGIIITGASAADEFFYFVADNGTGTGIYRVASASANMATDVIDAANEIAVQLIGTLDVADSSSLIAANFGG